jgi:tRNA A37 threonylcarbamoyladenosine modification protein TsaB
MIKNFLIINCIGKDDKIGLKVDKNFFEHNFNIKNKNYDQLTLSILNLIKKHKVIFDQNFSILINNGPGSFSSLRASLAVAKGIKISKNIQIFGFKNSDLPQFCLANIDVLIKKNLLEKNLIKPVYSS